MSTGYLFGYILAGSLPLASTPTRRVTVTVMGIAGQTQQATRGLQRGESGMGFLSLGNPVRPGTMPQADTGPTGGFVVPYTYQGHLTFSEFGGQTRLRFRVQRDRSASGGTTTAVREYDVTAMAFPNFGNTEEMINALTAQWDNFAVLQGMGEAVIDAAARAPIFSTIRSTWSRVSVITNPDERTHMISVVRIAYPAASR